ncbi:MAG TPA: PQQ-binding-like beta-propeller repeat protein [Kofleriaceae bacterium]|nr:PQQ-binding-like beta-propeller repeat protein [Kofleriaceae bacterium]
MLRCSALVAVLVGCQSPSASPIPPPPPSPSHGQPLAARPTTPKPPPVDKDSELITKKLVAMNANDKWGMPSRALRAGSVSPRKAPPVTRTAHGFEVRFGNGSPVSTPAVWNGRVYTSGGFNSREFYAFDATTGTSSWALDLSDDGPSASACEAEVCVFNTESCTTFAVDAKTGKQKWAWYLGDPQTSSPSIANGRVFTSYPAGAAEGKKPRPPEASHVLAAFDLQTGKLLWQDWLDADVISAPVAVGEFLYVATFNGTVVKLEQATGKIRYATKARATSAPVVEFVAGLESMYYTRRADDVALAQPAAHGSTPAASPASPAHHAAEQIIRTDHNEPQTRYTTEPKQADYLDGPTQEASAQKKEAMDHDGKNGFAGGAPASAHADAAEGLVGQSNVATIQQFQGSRILHLAALNVNTMGDEVIATDPDTGKQRWSHKLPGDIAKLGGALATAPLAAGTQVVVGTLDGKVLELDPATGKTQATFEVGGPIRAQPVVVDGWIYVGTEDGRLVAIDTGERDLTGWPMWGGNAARTGEVSR